MNTFRLLVEELKSIVTNWKVLIPVIAVICLPLLYSSSFLWSFWDPYGNLDKLPVAVVNEDKGASLDGASYHVGDNLVENLKKNNDFKWEFVSPQTGSEGIKNNQYYMEVVIPKDFSKNSVTVFENHPTPAKLQYTLNDGYNFLSAQLSTATMERVKEEVNKTLTKQYSKVLFQDFHKVSTGLKQAADGAKSLHSGAGAVKSGASQVKTNLATLSSGTAQLADSSEKAASGAHQLAQGTLPLSQGMSSLSSGLNQLNSAQGQLQQGMRTSAAGAEKLQSGLKQSLTGADSLSSGSTQVNSEAKSLSQGLTQLSQAEEQLEQGVDESSDLTSNLADSSGKLLTDLSGFQQELQKNPQLEQQLSASDPKLAEDLENISSDGTDLSSQLQALSNAQQASNSNSSGGLTEGMHQFGLQLKNAASGSSKLVTKGTEPLESGAKQLQSGLTQLNAGSSSLVSGQQQLVSGLTTFGENLQSASSAGNQLTTATSQVNSGAAQLDTGLAQLAGGASQANSGTRALSAGSNQLYQGTLKLNQGAGQLAHKLGDSAKETGKVKNHPNTFNRFAQPVTLTQHTTANLKNYGSGFTPYFVSLGLYVGALVLTVVWSMRDSAGKPKTGVGWWLSKFGILAIVGVAQALLVDLVVFKGLHLHAANPGGFVLFSIATSLVFLSLIQFLVSTLGDVGRYVAIVILVIQLCTSAGTFPVEVIPKFMQGFTRWLPMTYTVGGFRALISGDWSYLWSNVQSLAIFPAITIGLSIVVFSLLHRRNRETEIQGEPVPEIK